MSLLKRLGSAPQQNDTRLDGDTSVSPTLYPAETRTPLASATISAPPPPPAEAARLASSLEQRVMNTPASAASSASGEITQQRILELSLWIVDRVQSSLGNQDDFKRTPESERLLQERFTTYYRQSGVNLRDDQVKLLYEMVNDELFGFGPIEPLLRDESVTEVMVNGPHLVYIEQRGKLMLTP